jgi:hypothetical protein
VHRTVSGAPGWRLVNWPLSWIRRRRTAKIHRTVRWCTGLSGEPTVGRTIRAWRVAEPTVSWGHRTVRCAPDRLVCTRQCPVRQRLQIFNGRLRQFWKAICTGQRTGDVRWCTGLSGAPPDRRQGKCALGPFLSILVIKCPTQMVQVVNCAKWWMKCKST